MKKESKTFSDFERLVLVSRRIAESGVDITSDYQDWVALTLAYASQGEAARELYHLVCQLYPGYRRDECDEKFDNCLRTGRGDVSVATVFKMAKDAGIDISLPRGRRPKSAERKDEDKTALFEQVSEFLNKTYVFRYNILSERIEVKPYDGEWRNFDDRELNSVLTRLHSENIRVSKDNLATYINSSSFSRPYNPVKTYLEGLKPWNRRTDYIGRVFDYLHLEERADREFLREGFRLWFVCLVASGLELDVVNQLILILEGPTEGSGKTEFILRLLPTPLRQYLYSATQLSGFRDKDESLATAHNLIFLLDEIQLDRRTFNKLKNMVGGAGARTVTERAPYAHNATVRRVHASFAATTNHVDFLPEELGSRRCLVLPVVGSDNYDDLPLDKAYAQGYYLASHPRKYSTRITPEMIARLKEINRKYLVEDLCAAVIPTVLRKPKEGEEPQAVLSGEIIAWMSYKTGPNREYTPKKVNAAMRKLGFEPKDSSKGNVYFVKRLMAEDLKREGEQLAKEVQKNAEQPKNETLAKASQPESVDQPELPF